MKDSKTGEREVMQQYGRWVLERALKQGNEFKSTRYVLGGRVQIGR